MESCFEGKIKITNPGWELPTGVCYTEYLKNN